MYALDYAQPVSLAITLDARIDRAAQNNADTSGDASLGLSELERRVRDGLHAGEFHLVFQGAYRAASGVLARLEAQVRWTHPDYGLLLPGIFMMPLEDPRIARELVSFVVDSVCRELRDALAAKLPSQPIAVTVPAQVALLDSFAEELVRVADSYGVPASLLEIEVTDSVEAAQLLSLRTLTEGIREAGVALSIGKWGNGASSLASLGSLDVDTVIVARELMAAVPGDRRGAAVMTAIMDLLHALDMRVVVSGVDTQEQFQWLNRWPEALVQGLLFVRPQAGLARVLALWRKE
ncbi:EAL domain-containing protein (putative c-di-GMP-specific phosphodiesterase class I) [Paraburkholderia sp. BL18I3N2]|uniref:EAL domain-containing protein n=1 Tax=Paraburkholderia sp. BL18I3N2 TaxID=1938799 RepID=UPI000D071C35|nr:EAL domain-containing protein [Paraburkholderia sp. BL18I3N2]PRX36236.1 EAL domain-containing protein (putative c-di-GMP-specific phosphodiesterase class I) [Paraburkholderia sp. BL18I3N2]